MGSKQEQAQNHCIRRAVLQEKYPVQVHCLSLFGVVHTQEAFMCSILSEQLYRESDMLSVEIAFHLLWESKQLEWEGVEIMQ